MARLGNAIAHYFDRLQQFSPSAVQPGSSNPSFEVPSLTPQWQEFYSVSGVSSAELDASYFNDVGASTLLNLMSNPSTRTTKTNPSLLIVARAIQNIRTTGRPLTIITPSSANKATALRNAVLRAYELDLATPAQLNIVCLVPEASAHKVWASALSAVPELRKHNPLVVLASAAESTVKQLVSEMQELHQASTRDDKPHLWFTLHLDNYIFADRIRAWFEDDFFPGSDRRWHAHAVSSAFGLLGHASGTESTQSSNQSGYLLVQHLATPDMVTHLTTGSFDRSGIPQYTPTGTGLHQDKDPHFPSDTYSLDENLDPTFYTSRPTTQVRMEELIRSRGGDGVVVSLQECMQLYGTTRQLVGDLVDLPPDPRDLREWSLVMAVTGALLADRRGLLQTVDSLVIHASGSYSQHHFQPVPTDATTRITNVKDLVSIVSTISERSE